MQTIDQYTLAPDPAKLGQTLDTRLGEVIKTAKSLSAAPIGRLYVKDTSQASVDNLIKLPAASGDITALLLAGAVQLSDTIENDPTVTYPQFPLGHALPLKKQGGIWLWCETAYTPATDTLYLRCTVNGAGTACGFLRNDNDGGNAVSLSGMNVRGLNTLAAAGLIAVELLLL